MYVTAFGKDTIVVCGEKELVSKMAIAEIAKSAEGLLIPMHRSYLVNPDYVSSMERYAVVLLNGSRLPIPKKKYNELRELLLHYYEATDRSESAAAQRRADREYRR